VDRKMRKRLAILTALKDAVTPMSSASLMDALDDMGQEMSARSIRIYLSHLAEHGLVVQHGRRGCTITSSGLAEVHTSQTLQRVGFLSAKIDQMTYRMNFDLATRAGSVVVNTSIVEPRILARYADSICEVFARGYAMGNLLALLPPGEVIGDYRIPANRVGFCSVCSITLNGVLLKHGVPMRSRFGGLLELRDGKPLRFAEMIMYEGTTIDPLEIFIRSGMTNYLGAIRTGNGMIGVGMREVPADAVDLVISLAAKLDRIGLGAFLTIGMPGQAIFDVPVNEGHAGAVVIGGLNPISVLEESGHRVVSSALSGLLEYHRLFHYNELAERIARFIG